MIEIKQKLTPALRCSETATRYNKVRAALTRETLSQIDLGKDRAGASVTYPVTDRCVENPAQRQPHSDAAPQRNNAPAPSAAAICDMAVPRLEYRTVKGQKTVLDVQSVAGGRLRICFGWNIRDPRCDVDASAFMLDDSGKVPDDAWFVFYGQPESPDKAVILSEGGNADRKIIRVDLTKLDRRITRLAFTITINEALENRLNFSMLKDVYLRILDDTTEKELVSFQVDEYYPNITSMNLGELYKRNGQWRFNPVGNGVHTDLAGQCALYGVQIC